MKHTIAVGSDIGVACIAKGSHIYITEKVGELEYINNYEKLKEQINRLINKHNINPEIIACDLHPQYFSTKLAKELAKKFNAKLVKVQHHKAHLASVAYEHNVKDYVGIVMDGLGYGDDDKLWGGEVINSDGKRVGHLEEQYLIGGDSCVKYPHKFLFGILSRFIERKELEEIFGLEETDLYLKMLDKDYNIHTTTSAGRILDAVATMIGFKGQNTALELEKISSSAYDIKPIIDEDTVITTSLLEFLYQKDDKSKIAATALIYITDGLLSIAKKSKKTIIASGGVMNNKVIRNYLVNHDVLINKKYRGDENICVGQAILANQMS